MTSGRSGRSTESSPDRQRPVLLAIAGDTGSGKTTLAKGLLQALGPERCATICTDDYHRYDRGERRSRELSALHPDCNYVGVMEQHLRLLLMGEPILKPVYDHRTGRLDRPELVQPKRFVIVEGLLPLYTKRSRSCFDVMAYLDPPECVRRAWKVRRDVRLRGYTPGQARAALSSAVPDAERFVHPQRTHADLVVRFAPIPGREDPPATPLSAELLLRPRIRHPNLTRVLDSSPRRAIHLKLVRDDDGRPADALHIHGYASRAESAVVERAIWSELGADGEVPAGLGALDDGRRSEPLAVTQLILLYHLLEAGKTEPPCMFAGDIGF